MESDVVPESAAHLTLHHDPSLEFAVTHTADLGPRLFGRGGAGRHSAVDPTPHLRPAPLGRTPHVLASVDPDACMGVQCKPLR